MSLLTKNLSILSQNFVTKLSEIWVVDTGSGIRDLRSGIRDPRSGIRDPGSEIRDPRSGIRDPGSGINLFLIPDLDPGVKKHRIQDPDPHHCAAECMICM